MINELSQKIEATLKVYPTPFASEVNIAFTLPEKLDTKVSIFTLDGKLVKVLVDETLEAAEYQFPWNANNQNTGNYLVRIDAGDARVVRQMSKQ